MINERLTGNRRQRGNVKITRIALHLEFDMPTTTREQTTHNRIFLKSVDDTTSLAVSIIAKYFPLTNARASLLAKSTPCILDEDIPIEASRRIANLLRAAGCTLDLTATDRPNLADSYKMDISIAGASPADFPMLQKALSKFMNITPDEAAAHLAGPTGTILGRLTWSDLRVFRHCLQMGKLTLVCRDSEIAIYDISLAAMSPGAKLECLSWMCDQGYRGRAAPDGTYPAVERRLVRDLQSRYSSVDGLHVVRNSMRRYDLVLTRVLPSELPRLTEFLQSRTKLPYGRISRLAEHLPVCVDRTLTANVARLFQADYLKLGMKTSLITVPTVFGTGSDFPSTIRDCC